MVDLQSIRELGAALGSGLLIGVERGWRLRDEAAGSRVAGLRTFGLLGGLGGLIGLLGKSFHPMVPVVLIAALAVALVIAHVQAMHSPDDVSITMLVAAFITLALGMLATSGHPALATACAAVTTLILSLRTELHGMLAKLGESDVKSLARFAIIAMAILPFLPNEPIGPYDAWKPQTLWLVVVFVTGISFLGYALNRMVGARYGTMVTAAIGGLYSSTAVTVALSHKLKHQDEDAKLLTAGIAFAATVMLLRTLVLVAVLAGFAFFPLLAIVAVAVVVSAVAGALCLKRSALTHDSNGLVAQNPIALAPALGFLLLVAALAVAARWGELQYGHNGIATILLIIGTFDIDAATVTLGGLPSGSIEPHTAALVLAAPLVANTLFKAGLVWINAGRVAGKLAIIALLATAAAIGGMALFWMTV